MRAANETLDSDAMNKFPERRCSLRIVLGSLSDTETAKIFVECGFNPAVDFKCVQKVSAGTYVFVFRSHVKKERCLDLVDRLAAANVHVNDLKRPFTFVRIYGAPCELPDSLLQQLLGEYGNVRSVWRQTFREGPFKGVETGTRFMRIQLFDGAVLPPYLHFGNLAVAIVHDASEKCCRKCHSNEHLDYACCIQRCARCNELGHSPDSCENSPVCLLCKSLDHVASQCQFNWARPTLVSRAVVGHEEKNDEDGLSEESELNVEDDSDDDENESENEWRNECGNEDEHEDNDENDDEDKGECEDSNETLSPRPLDGHAGDSDDNNCVNGRLFSEMMRRNMDTDMSDVPFVFGRRARSRSRSPINKVAKVNEPSDKNGKIK